MKLRIHGNSIRIRLKQSEMAGLGQDGRAEDRIELGLDIALAYEIRICDPVDQVAVDQVPVDQVPVDQVAVSFEGHKIEVSVPRNLAEPWLKTEQVGIEAEVPTSSGTLKVLLEKDFKCLHRESKEDGSDYFPHPDA